MLVLTEIKRPLSFRKFDTVIIEAWGYDTDEDSLDIDFIETLSHARWAQRKHNIRRIAYNHFLRGWVVDPGPGKIMMVPEPISEELAMQIEDVFMQQTVAEAYDEPDDAT